MRRLLACALALAPACSSVSTEATDSIPSSAGATDVADESPQRVRPMSAWKAAGEVFAKLDREGIRVHRLRAQSDARSARVGFEAEFHAGDAVAATELMVGVTSGFASLPGYSSYSAGKNHETGGGIVVSNAAVHLHSDPQVWPASTRRAEHPEVAIRRVAARGVGAVAVSWNVQNVGSTTEARIYRIQCQQNVALDVARDFVEGLEEDGVGTVCEIQLARKGDNFSLALDLALPPERR